MRERVREMKSQIASQVKTVRRGIAIPRQQVEGIHHVAPPDFL
jgi:hypothetical protein